MHEPRLHPGLIYPFLSPLLSLHPLSSALRPPSAPHHPSQAAGREPRQCAQSTSLRRAATPARAPEQEVSDDEDTLDLITPDTTGNGASSTLPWAVSTETLYLCSVIIDQSY